MEPFYPLHAYVCDRCFLVQLGEFVSPGTIFSEYAYFSSYAETWLAHCRAYTDDMIQRFGLRPSSNVIEVASNDGYLLQYFVRRGIPVLGIEPAANVASVATERGIPTVVEFLGADTARRIIGDHGRADLVAANNVIAHVPDLNDFVRGLKILMKPEGVLTVEFPHIRNLVEQNQFDTIYHEHFSYFSFTTIEKVLAAHALVIFDVQKFPTHGGSLRIFARHASDEARSIAPAVAELKREEESWGVGSLATYTRYAEKVESTKRNILRFLSTAKEEGKRVTGYGHPGRGTRF